EEERNDDNDIATDDDIKKTTRTEIEVSIKEAETRNRAENKTKNKPIKKAEKEEAGEAPSSQLVEYYLKHMINEKLIKGLVDNNRNSKGVLVEVAGHVYPVNFVILDIKENEKRPFILGTPFLKTANAMIKFDKGTITLRSGKSKISFLRIPESLCKDEKGIKNDIEHVAPTMTMNKLVVEWEEKIKLHQEKEMEFDQWRSKNFKNEHHALVKIKDGMDDEGEVT
ncbi:zinc finger, CCHC-type containing protein, partial [Tanacetum coccineum]